MRYTVSVRNTAGNKWHLHIKSMCICKESLRKIRCYSVSGLWQQGVMIIFRNDNQSSQRTAVWRGHPDISLAFSQGLQPSHGNQAEELEEKCPMKLSSQLLVPSPASAICSLTTHCMQRKSGSTRAYPLWVHVGQPLLLHPAVKSKKNKLENGFWEVIRKYSALIFYNFKTSIKFKVFKSIQKI